MTAGSGIIQPSHEPFATIMNVFRDHSYHDEVLAYIFQQLLKNTLVTIFTFTGNTNTCALCDVCAVLIQ